MQTEIISLIPLAPISSLEQSAVDDYTAQVINNAKEIIPDPLDRYARLRVLKAIIDIVVEDAGAQAEYFCEQKNLGSEGTDFTYNGLVFRRQFILDYNYAANATDEEGDPVDYTASLQRLERTQRTLKARRAIVNANKELIEAAHPNMVPDVVRVTMSYRGLAPEDK